MEKFFLDTTTPRMKLLYDILSTRHEVHPITDVGAEGVYVLPPNRKLTTSEVTTYTGKRVLCGALPAPLEGFTDINQDSVYSHRISRLTAEGTLALLITNTLVSMDEARILVTGFGKLSRAILRLLRYLSVRPDVVTYDADERSLVVSNTLYHSVQETPLDSYDAIINTIPYAVFGDVDVAKVREDCYFLNLANVDCTVSMKPMGYVTAPGLPDRVSPVSAANAMAECVERLVQSQK